MSKYDYEEVCTVGIEKGAGLINTRGGLANGVFLSPRHVLTAHHVVEGAIGWVANLRGDISAFKLTPCFNRRLDVAVIELQKPIGTKLALPPRKRPVFLADAPAYPAFLKTRFEFASGVHLLEMNTATALKGIEGHDELTEFTGAIMVKPGFSGSPVFTEDGRTLLSVLTCASPERQRQSLKTAAADKGHEPRIPFLGPQPKKFSQWFETVRERLPG